MNIIAAAFLLKAGKKVFNQNENGLFLEVHLDDEENLCFRDGSLPHVNVKDLLSDKWTVIDE